MTDKDLYGGMIRLHILHHAAKEPVFGLGIIEELRHHGYQLSPGTLYRVIFQHRLHLCGETIEAVAHVGDTGNQPDFGACWQVVITSFICPVMILMTSPDYFTTHMGLPDTGSGWISASTLNTVFRSSGFITASGAPCAITRPLASTTR